MRFGRDSLRTDAAFTTLLVGNPSAIGLDMDDTETQGQLMQTALTEHLERCGACRRWGRQS